jgi:epoxide hydrolase
MSSASHDIRPFTVAVSQESLDDLRSRLDRVRWASDIPGSGADYAAHQEPAALVDDLRGFYAGLGSVA